MCSWCWGFEPVRKRLFDKLPKEVSIKTLLGGLAPDSNQPMPKEMQSTLQRTWQKIQQAIPGTEFNFDFWINCQPRRSTYPSNRAVIAARLQGKEFESCMTLRIQKAYYLEGKNPSDNSTLIELANDIGLDKSKFKNDLSSDNVESELIQEIKICSELQLNNFPSLAFYSNEKITPIKLDYLNEDNMLREINEKYY